MKINHLGWCEEADISISPNQNERPEGTKISLIVIHSISLPRGVYGGKDVNSLFMNCLECHKRPDYEDLEDLKVSSHFVITRDGLLKQYVSCNARAWHAGVSEFRGRESCNDFSIGIELEGCDDQPFEEIQYKVLAELIDAICEVYPIEAVAGHEHVAPGRKTDPGTCFDWFKTIKLCNTGKAISFPFVG